MTAPIGSAVSSTVEPLCPASSRAFATILVSGSYPGGLATVISINSPSCGDTGAYDGLIEVPLAAEFGAYNGVDVDCSLDVPAPANDVEAFSTGWTALTQIPEELVAGDGE